MVVATRHRRNRASQQYAPRWTLCAVRTGDGCRQCPRTMQTFRLEIPRWTNLIMNR